jgi:hypothetical protein
MQGAVECARTREVREIPTGIRNQDAFDRGWRRVRSTTHAVSSLLLLFLSMNCFISEFPIAGSLCALCSRLNSCHSSAILNSMLQHLSSLRFALRQESGIRRQFIVDGDTGGCRGSPTVLPAQTSSRGYFTHDCSKTHHLDFAHRSNVQGPQ